MQISGSATAPWVLLTGASGFVGQCLLGELLDRGHRVLALVRAPTPADARTRLSEALTPWGRNVDSFLESGRLAILRGDVNEGGLGIARQILQTLHGSIASVIHAAASTTFQSRSDGEPVRTNVDGTRELFRVARECGCLDWRMISTAYVCGRSDRADEQLLSEPPTFHNAYERSKWLAEVESAAAAADCGATLTIYRPSVVVGHSQTGVATRFVGVYYLFRATWLLARAAEQHEIDRHQIPLRVCADADARPNLIFADDLARDFVDLFVNPSARGGVYHLTHPAPLTNRQIKSALERHYNIGGGSFVGAATSLPDAGQSPYEEIFAGMTTAISNYIFDSPVFDRSRTDAFLTSRATPWTEQRLHCLIKFAESVGWRNAARDADPHSELNGFGAYFERFLPRGVERSSVSRLAQLNLDVRFRIDTADDGDWWCRFRNGRVAESRRTDGRIADVIYRTTPGAFWRAVAGEVTGVELFLSGDAQIEGDIERGLKFAMILEQFVREFPCQREALLADDLSAS